MILQTKAAEDGAGVPVRVKRSKRYRETQEVAGAARRMIRATGRRAGGDVDALPLLLALRAEVDEAMVAAVESCREEWGWSWEDVGRVLGVHRTTAQQRWGR